MLKSPNARFGQRSGKASNANAPSAVKACKHCGEELHHERAQDFPPYITITIVGHVIVTLLMIVEARTQWSLTTHLLVWIPLATVMTLGLMQPVKGGVVGMQWAVRMFGFGGEEEA